MPSTNRASRRRIAAPIRGAGTLLGVFALGFMLTPDLATAQLALPVSVPSATLFSPDVALVYTFDLDSLPARPQLLVDVQTVSGNPSVLFEIELTSFVGLPADPFPFSTGCPLTDESSWLSDPQVGGGHLEADLFFCDPELDTWNGVDAQLIVRALDFGASGEPVKVSVDIEGVTFVPTELLLQQVSGPRRFTAVANQDTVIYGDDFDANNGAGDFLWSGTRVVPFLGGPGVYFRYPRKSLLAFASLANGLPSNAIVSNVELDLFAIQTSPSPPSSVDVFAIAPGDFWFAGPVDSPDEEFFGAPSTSSSYVDYEDRSFFEAWLTPGVDMTTGSPLASKFVATSGGQTFSSPALAAAVQDWVDSDAFNDGLLISSPPAGIVSAGVQFASEDHPDPNLHPRLTVDFDQLSQLGEGRIDPDLADFTAEGEDFRWVYDADADGIFVTSIGGVCGTVPPTGGPGSFTYPYSYAFTGDPGYIGLDCCTWRIFSAEGQVVGTGQAIFFHNLDPLDPANLPPRSRSARSRQSAPPIAIATASSISATTASGSRTGLRSAAA